MFYPPTIPVVYKDPSADLDYGYDLSPAPTQLIKPWLAPGELVTSLTVTADTGITVQSSGIYPNATGVPGSLILSWLTGCEVGTAYLVRFTFTTSQGRTDTKSIQVVGQLR